MNEEIMILENEAQETFNEEYSYDDSYVLDGIKAVVFLLYSSRRKPCIVTEKCRGQLARLFRVADRGPWGC